MPTVVEAASAAYPETFSGKSILPMEGLSLVRAFHNQPLDRDALYWEHEGNAAVRQGDLKLVRLAKEGPWELYDLKADRTEQHNLATQRPEQVRELAALLGCLGQSGAGAALSLELQRAKEGRQEMSHSLLKKSLHLTALFTCTAILLARPLSSVGAVRADPAEVVLAEKGQSLHPIVVVKGASERVRTAATTLADYLARMSGATFTVQEGAGDAGIAIGLAADFPQWAGNRFAKPDATHREDYLLRSHAKGLVLLGASELAVEHAVWDLLYRLGHRQFFPGEHWEVVPRNAELALAVDDFEHPDYYARRIWYGYGAADYAKEPYLQWCSRNRATSGIELNSGHSYDQILGRHKEVFADHPEYLALVAGARRGPKFCLSNPAVRKLIIDHKLAQFAADPTLQSVSIDPSDGGGWCECEACQKLGSISDQAVGLGNDVAAAVQQAYGDKYVGMYAYAYHSPPPSIRVHPRLVVSVATAFIKGDYTVDQLAAGWQKQGATIGIREYFSVNTWDRDLPGRSRGSSLQYVSEKLPHFHQLGARFFSAESSDNWGCNGLGYFLASRILWDVDEAQNIEQLVEDFLSKSFGAAKEPMSRFYRLMDGSQQPLVSDDLVGRMYRAIDDARKFTTDSAVHRRLDDLVLYARYVELYLDYSSTTGAARQAAFEQVLRHAYRMKNSMMIHTMGLYRDLPARDKSVSLPADAVWSVKEGPNPWKSSVPFTSAEIAAIVSAGMERRQLVGFTPIAYGSDLVPATPLKLTASTPGNFGGLSRGVRHYYTWVEQPPKTFKLEVTSGLVYANQAPARLALFPSGDTLGQAVAHAEIPGTQQPVAIELATTEKGLARIELSDRGRGTRITWSQDVAVTIPATRDAPADFNGRWTLYFYVPKGTKVVGGYSSAGAGELLDADAQKVHTFGREAGYFQVPVAKGQAGRLWRFSKSAGERILMTVPPYLARTAEELLLPAEVVAADAKK